MSRKSKVVDIDKGYKKIVRELGKINGSYTKVGVQSDAEYQDGETVASIAAKNEYGTETIPSRPFMRQSFDKNKRQLDKFKVGAYNKILSKKIDSKKALAIIGEWFQKEIVKTITNGDFEANSSVTQKLKGSSKPLIDTGTLRSSIKHIEVMK